MLATRPQMANPRTRAPSLEAIDVVDEGSAAAQVGNSCGFEVYAVACYADRGDMPL